MPTNPTVRNPGFLRMLATGNGGTQSTIDRLRSDVDATAARMRQASSAVSSLLGTPDVKALTGSPAGRRLLQSGGGAGGGASIKAGKGVRGQIVRTAANQLGKPYVWGGSNPGTSFDCSGLVQWAYDKVGIKLPRVSADQARYGRRVPTSQLRKGDLVAWDNSSRNVGADHIAVYIGNGRIIEAAKTGTPIRVRPLGQNEGAWGVKILR